MRFTSLLSQQPRSQESTHQLSISGLASPDPSLESEDEAEGALATYHSDASSPGSQTCQRPQQQSRFLTRVCRRVRTEMASYRKPGLKRELASWIGVAIVGTSFIITLLFILTFVWLPKNIYTTASHNFISENPITKDGQAVDGLERWMTDFSRSVVPIMCHSHNDYWRPYPLFSALAAGCTGIEADVYLNEDGTELLVGHDPSALSPNRTLKSMYLDPLLEILEIENPEERWDNHTYYDRARGVFATQPNTTLTLLIDVKTEPQKTWELVVSQLEPLRRKQFLSRYQMKDIPGEWYEEKNFMWPGPLVIVGSGNMNGKAYEAYARSRNHETSEWWPFKPELLSAHWEYHDYWYDAPLESLPQRNQFDLELSDINGDVYLDNVIGVDYRNANYASVSFKKAIGSVHMGFTSKQLATLREQIRVAQRSSLKSRYWDLPSWPISYRDYVWDVLTREGVDMLSVDDLESASRRGWNKGYIRSVVWMFLVSAWIFLSSVVTLIIVYRLLKERTNLLARQQGAIYLQ